MVIDLLDAIRCYKEMMGPPIDIPQQRIDALEKTLEVVRAENAALSYEVIRLHEGIRRLLYGDGE